MVYQHDPKLEFYYMTHLDNLNSILKEGILSNREIKKRGLNPKKIAKEDIVKRRIAKGIDDYVNLYIQPRNAMLYKVSRMKGWKIVVLGISSEVLSQRGIKLSIGNAASDYSTILNENEINSLPKFIRDIRRIRYWNVDTETDISKYVKKPEKLTYHYLSIKKFLQSEVLVPKTVSPKYIRTIYVPNIEIKEEVEGIFRKNNHYLETVILPELFFLPRKESTIYTNIKVIQGDMFISDCELITISVNTVGVMGKGLASRFKYMYPDAFVIYQNLCKYKKIQPGVPQIYKSEKYERSFLFFPTKRHWKENSKIEMIKKGLNWCVENFPKHKIKSAAFPALGCGLGNLDWKDVGPLMVKELLKIKNTNIEIFLPAEKDLPDDYFKKEFYINDKENARRINLELF